MLGEPVSPALFGRRSRLNRSTRSFKLIVRIVIVVTLRHRAIVSRPPDSLPPSAR